MRSSLVGSCFALLGLALAGTPATATEPLLRFPDVHGDTVVFASGDDLWSAPTAGGTARRLTDHEGVERQPRFSPDGRLVAFTGELDGNADVYVMNADGSDVRRLTFHPGDDEVVGWHPTRGMILFRSTRESFNRFDRLFLVDTDGRNLEALPLHEAARGCFSPDGRQIAYNRSAREDRTWKRYFGGRAQDLWLYDLTTGRDRRLTDFPGTDHLPMWVGETVYFVSDRSGRRNLFSLDPSTGAVAQVTDHSDFDVLRASEGGERIVYEIGGSLWLLDTRTGSTSIISVELTPDPRDRRPYRTDLTEHVTEVACSPEGGRALVTARGEVFSLPRRHGATRNLTSSPGARDKNPAWSPDGRRVAYLSDAGGEYQVWVRDASGEGEPEQLTHLEPGYRHTLRWSPDGSHLAFADHTLALLVLDLSSREVMRVDRAEHEPVDSGLDAKPISDFAWSPDGRWLAYSKIGDNLVSNLHVYSLDQRASFNVSSGLFNDFGPVWSPDGEHLLFISNRRFDPTLCDLEWELVYKKVAGLYALTLRRGGAPLLPERSDESAVAGDDAGWADPAESQTPQVVVDLEGLADRVEALPVPAGNYRRLAASHTELLYLDAPTGDFNRFDFRQPPARTLGAYSVARRTTRTLAEGVDDYDLSADGRHVALRKGTAVAMLSLEPDSGAPEVSDLDLGQLETLVDPPAEWRQMLLETWRMERDFYYESGMNGLDWDGVWRRYEPLLDRLATRRDLGFLIGELIGELATSHTYVAGGDRRRQADEVSVGLLGADWEADAATGRYRVRKVYRVPDWSAGVTPPLAGPGKDVREGDLLLTVDGREVTTEREVHAFFQGLAGRQVKLTMSRGQGHEGSYDLFTTALASERMLRYLDWVEGNRRRVEEASGGRLGYLHLPDTYLGSAVELPKHLYSQTTKQGLVVDGRFNGGGLDPHVFLHRLARRPLTYWTRRHSHDQVGPLWATSAHMVCLTNLYAGSGGDMLPYLFRAMGLGPVIGTRTWGGLVGVSMSIPLLDGGVITAPDYRVYSPEGNWVVENEGVTPDIEVDLEPAEVARGWDAQLEKAIEVLMERLEKDPVTVPQHPPFPRQDLSGL